MSDKSNFNERGAGFLYSLFFEDSLYESSSLSHILNKYITDKGFHKGLSIGITNILNGNNIDIE